VKVHVESAPWVVVDEIHMLRVSEAARTGAAAATPPMPAAAMQIKEAPLPSGAIGADVTFTLRATTDDAFVVVASGPAGMAPIVPGPAVETRPWAMSGAIWIDADGDRASLGR